MKTTTDDAPLRSAEGSGASLATSETSSHAQARKAAALAPGYAYELFALIDISNPEGTIAAYCDFNDIGMFRRFYTSPLVLPFYLRPLECPGYKRGVILSSLKALIPDK